MSKKAAKAEAEIIEPTMAPPPVVKIDREEMVHAVAAEVMGRMLACGSCKFWARTGPSFGQCLLSGKYGHAPIVTPDKASCTSWAE